MTLSPRLSAAALLLAAIATRALGGAEDAAITVPRLTHPGAGQTFYFVLTDRFANGRTDNDTGGLRGGPDVHGFDPERISHYHGGDLAGLISRLDYLDGLGVTAIWLTPPQKNKPMQSGTAGYHGYWITDFLQIDPHLGTNDEFRELVRLAHARGMKVFMDIIVNHTADVIDYEGGVHGYRTETNAPYRDAAGRVFSPRDVAFNGYRPTPFPEVDPRTSFPYRPFVPAAEAGIKRPAWLNDVTLYHNRGNSTFSGESSIHGDFAGLDDLFTEHPRVVAGFIEIFRAWLDTGVDGFRIDTTRHVNSEFWQAFIPALREEARRRGRPDFLQFGEVYNDAGDSALLAEFSTNTLPLDTTIDFGFFAAARRFVSRGGPADEMAAFFERDDYYTDHDSNVHATTTFLGNHDAGRFGYFLQQDNPDADPARLAALARLGHGLLYLSRGQPVVYYGDEQGMIGRGGNDMQAREDMFAARAPDFATAALLGTKRTGAEDKFDVHHPFYRLFAQLGDLRAQHVALRTGALIPRATNQRAVLAFSRFDRDERVEYLAVFNNSRVEAARVTVPTSQREGATLEGLFASTENGSGKPSAATVDARGAVTVSVPPLQLALWRATTALPPAGRVELRLVTPASGAKLGFHAREIDGLVFPTRTEIRAEVQGGDGVGEVTFTLRRASRPDEVEYLGTDDTPPYRLFWSPPADLAPDETLSFHATHDDLRGGRAHAAAGNVRINAAPNLSLGIPGTTVPRITRVPEDVSCASGASVMLTVAATGTAPLEFQWLCNGEIVPGATSAELTITPSRSAVYHALVRNVAGTVISASARVTVDGVTR